MKRKNIFSIFFLCLFVIMSTNNILASSIEPGSETSVIDFSNISRGLYYDGNDFYYLMDIGIPATNYLYSLDGDRFYFGDDGKMVKDEIIEYDDQKYYFDTNGAMVKNRWVTYRQVDTYDGTEERKDYYFGPSGRAYRAQDGAGVLIKVIDGEKFGFNVDGEKLEGYVNFQGVEIDEDDDFAYAECVYYFDPAENGSAATGWHLYDGQKDTAIYEDNDEMYLYFDEKTCRKVYSKVAGRYLYKNIDGQRYMFDENGVRYFEWYGTASSSDVSPKYFREDYDGYLAKGWFSAVPQADSIREKNRNHNANDEEMWFYADNRGNLVRSAIKKIGHYTYAFDEDGVMQSNALVVVKKGVYQRAYDCDELTRDQVVMAQEDGGIIANDEYFMYFVEPEDNENLIGSMCQLNRSVKISLKDDDIVFSANKNGGYSRADNARLPIQRSGKYFQHGVLLKSLNDTKYGIVLESFGSSTGGYDKYVVVNSIGVLQTRYGSYKDNNGNYILTINNDGEFVGIYSVEAKFTTSQGWMYKPDKTWIRGFPPVKYKVNDSSYFINFRNYTNGIADDPAYNIVE